MLYISLLKQDITRKGQVNKTSQPELDKGDSNEYKFETIHDNEVYINKLEGHLLGLYYLVS